MLIAIRPINDISLAIANDGILLIDLLNSINYYLIDCYWVIKSDRLDISKFWNCYSGKFLLTEVIGILGL
jgi:hypothetical protein